MSYGCSLVFGRSFWLQTAGVDEQLSTARSSDAGAVSWEAQFMRKLRTSGKKKRTRPARGPDHALRYFT